ncbi:hypothetical protein Clacol_006730 [Clathrus columnatus]|uniref:Uncharacterized protein n=1 Tax=Clathrus columnatus TaxID=1419009 RepID=A0AAV5AH80_9AGAM|nr:hypothetical protein Clacol_006730 [Clathrus columnatus]
MSTIKPLISIVGTTGVGKSRLAIELALAISKSTRKHVWQSAKIINSDAMQAYVGADVLTNKVPLSERHGIEHLLMDFKDPGDQYVVGQWVNDAIQNITALHEHSVLPIVVGGTAYWTQHLIFSNRLASLNSRTLFDDEKHLNTSSSYSPELAQRIQSLPSDLMHLFLDLPRSPRLEQASALHALLTILDPTMASRWHWKDTRKVLRSLELLKERGCLTSEVMAEQALSQTQPRYHTLIFWLYANSDVLYPRLETRVDEMMKQGLVNEVIALRDTLRLKIPSRLTDNEMPGIYQSIGFKEFADYLSTESPTKKQYEESVERIKISTRQYAKRQVHWIRNKLLPAIEHSDTSESKVIMYLLDATEGPEWQAHQRSRRHRRNMQKRSQPVPAQRSAKNYSPGSLSSNSDSESSELGLGFENTFQYPSTPAPDNSPKLFQ